MSGKNPPILCPDVEHQGSSCDTCKRSEELERRELEVSKLVASLKAERLALNSTLNATHDRVAGRLPLEIVSYIFQIYIKMHILEEKGNGVFYSSRMTAAPLHLGSICRQWRRIAWSMPNLWATMTIDISSKFSATTVKLAEEWFERTGALPLSIRLYASDWYHPMGEDEEVNQRSELLLSLIDVLNSFSLRWGSLDLEIPCEFLHYVRSSINEGQVSVLQQLRLTSIGPPFSIHHFLKSNPGHFPKHLSIFYVRLDRMDEDWWPNLTNFAAGSISMEECIALLRRTPTLESLELQGVHRSRPEWELETEAITHLSVRKLSFSRVGTPATEILDHLTFPLLQEFECSSTASSFVFMNSLKALIGRSSCKLKKLKFWQLTHLDSDDIPHQLLRFFKMTPTLKTLDLRFRENAHIGLILKKLLNPTLGDSGGPTLLPNVELLRISVDPKFSWEFVADIFEASYLNVGHSSDLGEASLLHPRHSLKVELNVIDSAYHDEQRISNNTLRRLNKLISQGVALSLPYPS